MQLQKHFHLVKSYYFIWNYLNKVIFVQVTFLCFVFLAILVKLNRIQCEYLACYILYSYFNGLHILGNLMILDDAV